MIAVFVNVDLLILFCNLEKKKKITILNSHCNSNSVKSKFILIVCRI